MAFVEKAGGYAAEITVRRTDSEEAVDGKSIMQMLMLAGTCGTEIEISADGGDEAAALAALVELVRAGFDDEA
jgi:phosphocarrier protein HPr